MPDLEKIKKHLDSIIIDLDNLQKRKNITIENLKNDLDLLWIIERGLYLLIQNLLDIFAHIAAADFKLQWESYSDLIEIIFAKKLISKNDKDELTQIVGFRNRLSHDYLSLDNEILVEVMQNKLSNFSKYIEVIKNYCKL